jgi:dihydrofolate synthase/folylpolyglutamate synthase
VASARNASLAGWLAYLETLHPKTIDLGLARVQAVRQALKLNPDFPLITVGGTNGKGSTCAYLEAMLMAADYYVGCYTSPHLLRYNERIRIAGQEVADGDLCAAFAAIDAARGTISLSYFEFGTLAALWLFARAGVAVAVLEVGLGGRLDAVNAFDADCAIVTSVDIDHTDYLGDTRELIGYEKAGIFRAGRPAICGDLDAPHSLLQHAANIGAQLDCIGSAFHFVRDTTVWHFNGRLTHPDLPEPRMPGAYQFNNAACAIAALDALRPQLAVSDAAMRQGLQQAQVAGRFQVVPGQPELILDVAHNPHAAHALAANLQARPCQGKTIALWAMLSDKDIAGVAGAMAGVVDVWVVAGLDVPRGAAAEQLTTALAGCVGEVLSCQTVAKAWQLACELARENDRICAFGSFYTVAQVLQLHHDCPHG